MAVDAFLKLDGVKGESVSKGHQGEIDVLSWAWGLSQSGTTHSGTGGGAGKVNVQDISFTHYVDAATPNLIQACCTGKHFASAVLTCVGKRFAINHAKLLSLKQSRDRHHIH